MQKKLTISLFVTAVLMSSFTASVLPVANAFVTGINFSDLTQRTVFTDAHLTASYGGTNVCGDHICKSAEKFQWFDNLSQLQHQHVSIAKIGKASTYLDSLTNNLSNATQTSQPMTENIKMGENMTGASNMNMGKNMTSSGTANMTENMNMSENMSGTGNKTMSTK
jgi:hypothetical protein